MSAIRRKPKRHLMLFSGRAHPALAQAVAEDLGTEIVPTQAYDFACVVERDFTLTLVWGGSGAAMRD